MGYLIKTGLLCICYVETLEGFPSVMASSRAVAAGNEVRVSRCRKCRHERAVTVTLLSFELKISPAIAFVNPDLARHLARFICVLHVAWLQFDDRRKALSRMPSNSTNRRRTVAMLALTVGDERLRLNLPHDKMAFL